MSEKKKNFKSGSDERDRLYARAIKSGMSFQFAASGLSQSARKKSANANVRKK